MGVGRIHVGSAARIDDLHSYSEVYPGAESNGDLYIPAIALSSTTSFLSIVGSSCIVYMAVTSGELRKNIKQRLLLSASIADLMHSISWLVVPYAAPW